jgi:uncharacterized membrane protein YqjE
LAEPTSPPTPEAVQHAGLLHALRTLIANVIATLRARGELLQVEFEEERLRVAGIVVVAGAAALFLALGVIMLSFFVMLLFWDTHRVQAAGALTLAYFLIGIICALIARQRSQVKSRLFSASLAELAKDSERLTTPDA